MASEGRRNVMENLQIQRILPTRVVHGQVFDDLTVRHARGQDPLDLQILHDVAPALRRQCFELSTPCEVGAGTQKGAAAIQILIAPGSLQGHECLSGASAKCIERKSGIGCPQAGNSFGDGGGRYRERRLDRSSPRMARFVPRQPPNPLCRW